MLSKNQFDDLFWRHHEWTQNGTYPDWPWAVYKFIEEQGIRNVVEIGVATGPVSFAIALTKPDIYYLIDNEAEGHPIIVVVDRLADKLNCKVSGYFLGNSEEEIKKIDKFELLIHDGWHVKESVEHDCKYAFDHGAHYAIVHDGNFPEVVEGVKALGLPWEIMDKSFGCPILVRRWNCDWA